MKSSDMACRPTMAWLTVNRTCNLRCVWCYGEDTGYNQCDTMSLDMAKRLISIGADSGVKHVNLIGGEPSMWPFLFEFNRFCKSIGVTTGLITNAVLFGDDGFWERYKESPCDSVSASVKSVDPLQFKSVTKSNKFDQSIKGIGRAVGLDNSSISTVYNSLIGIDGLKQIASKCRDLGAKFINVDLCTAVIEDGGISKGYSIEMRQMATDIMDFLPFLDEMYQGNVDVGVYIPLCLFPERFIRPMLDDGKIATICHVYDRCGLNFDTNGAILPCNQLLGSVIARYGVDYLDSRSLMNHLNSKSLCDDYRQLLRYPSKECDDCLWRTKCRGGCLLNWMVYDPSICKAVR